MQAQSISKTRQLFSALGGIAMALVLTIYTPEDKAKFPKGSDAYEMLNCGDTLYLDAKGMIVKREIHAYSPSNEGKC